MTGWRVTRCIHDGMRRCCRLRMIRSRFCNKPTSALGVVLGCGDCSCCCIGAGCSTVVGAEMSDVTPAVSMWAGG